MAKRKIESRKPKMVASSPSTSNSWDIGFVAGLWFAVEQLVQMSEDGAAENIIRESGLPGWEFRHNLEQTGYMQEELTPLLDRVFGK